MQRVYNFSAGPSMLPLPVLEKVQKELLCYDESGQSVMEMSHRSAVYDKIFCDTKQKIKDILSVPDDYEILFIQGGASMQFDMLALNLKKSAHADYVVTGEFSGKAAKAATRITEAHIIASGKECNFTKLPPLEDMRPCNGSDYLHICHNNTIFGSRFNLLPECGDVPLVADMSSSILSEPVDIKRYGLIYAGAQKNMAPAGFALVIIRKDLLERSGDTLPVMQSYKTYAESNSMANTPPTFSIYVAGVVVDYLNKEYGGLSGVMEYNKEKAALLYDYIDNSGYYKNSVSPDCRSVMNVTFTTPNEQSDNDFCKAAAKAGLVNLKGHRLVGGMRASIYNAMPREGVVQLIDFMKGFSDV